MAEKENKKKPQASGAKTAAKGKSKSGKKGRATKEQATPEIPKDYTPRLWSVYKEQIAPALKEKFQIANPMLVPRLDKIVVNVGIGDMHLDQKLADSIAEELGLISGQKPVFTRARKSIANFKLRDGMVVGCRVTLRRSRMYEFFDRLISVVIPRVRDFRGLSDRSFDGRGNFNFGVKEQIIFPEIDYDKVLKIHGMDICIATTARTDEQALELLKGFGFPFRRRTGGEEPAAA